MFVADRYAEYKPQLLLPLEKNKIAVSESSIPPVYIMAVVENNAM